MISTLNRYFSRELSLTFFAVSAILIVVIVSKSFVSLLAKVMDGKLPADVVISLLSLGILKSAILLTPFALLLASMLVLGRLYRDSEIYAVKACGVSSLGLIKYASLLILPLVVILLVLSVFSTPWASKQIEVIKLNARGHTNIHGLTPGQFFESRNGKWVVFIESADKEKKRVENIFIYEKHKNEIAIETAKVAQQEDVRELGGASLVLSEGQRYQGVPGEGGFTVLTFNQHAIRIDGLGSSVDKNDPEFMTTKELIKSGRLEDLAEFQWRISVPIAAILLVLLAFPLSISNPRQGRFAKIGLAITIYLIYSNLLILAQDWVADGKLPVIPGLFSMHIMLAVIIFVLMYRQRMVV